MADYSHYELDDSSSSENIDDDLDATYIPSLSEMDGFDESSNSDSNVENSLSNEKIAFGTDLSLGPIVKTKSNSHFGLWKLFGVLMKNGVVIKVMADKIFCSLCFGNEILKGSVLTFYCSYEYMIQDEHKLLFNRNFTC